MSRKWKIFLVVIASAVVLSLAGTAVALADDSTTTTTTSNAYLAAVAAKLGVTETVLTDAMKQTRQELASAAIDQKLAEAVTNGTITQAEADAVRTWIAAQPDIADKAAMKEWWAARPKLANSKVYNGFLLKGKIARMRGWAYGCLGINNTDFINKLATLLGKQPADVQAAFQSAAGEMKTAAFKTALAKAVENGKLTQEQADQIQSWWAQRPAALDKIAPGFGLKNGMHGMMKGFGGPQGNLRQQSTQSTQSTSVTY
jgi:hypothetical protein